MVGARTRLAMMLSARTAAVPAVKVMYQSGRSVRLSADIHIFNQFNSIGLIQAAWRIQKRLGLQTDKTNGRTERQRAKHDSHAEQK